MTVKNYEAAIAKYEVMLRNADLTISQYVAIKRESDRVRLELAELKLGGTGYARI
tara:strand:- start:2631 stop:2795 length:165 start_codon:yes stop_codon:yes gene_type:complete